MATAHDVAAYILKKRGKMTAMKLQKLVYYSQAWSLVWDDRALFRERIEAWVNGPVVRSLYEAHRGQYEVKTWPKGDADKLDDKARETVDAVLKFYGDKASQWLSDLTHSEEPWRAARRGLAPTEPCGNEISHASMAEYYSSLPRA
ncbi:MAG TPA: type II toxin-antitoxin system antitoxin SocA domain-containing protein [Thermoanaerobaculia bacterium]|nr:type II toxin-antitoxin system antitoxin SocA domain-containing protein [Thermoanaerobaculia bacterium]